jgi:hypothetical protein
VEDSGAILYTVEVAFGDRHYEITQPDNPHHIQLRTHNELWHKENALNIAISRLPADAKYIAWIDADVNFSRTDWAQETLHLLQHYDFIQMFSYAQDLNKENEPANLTPGFIYKWLTTQPEPHDPEFGIHKDPNQKIKEEGYPYYGAVWAGSYGHPGFAWAARKESLNKVGMLIDWSILGSGDWHMASALIGQVQISLSTYYSDTYHRWTREWQHRAEEHIKKNVGFMPGMVTHRYHGEKIKRAYDKRHKLLGNVDYDPELDLKKDWQGLWQLTMRNIVLRDGIRAYGRMRDEDA